MFCFLFHDKRLTLTYVLERSHHSSLLEKCYSVFRRKQNLLILNLVIRKKNCNDSYPNVKWKDRYVSINFVLLLAKYFIFWCENRKETPCMFQFGISISERRGLEEIKAFKRNKTDQHIEKWQHLYYICSFFLKIPI